METKELTKNTGFKSLKEILQGITTNILQNKETKDSEKITSNQLTTIFSIAKERGISQKELSSLIQSNFNKEIIQLSIQEASELIKGLLK
jgi:nucleoside recognition membrane protein YjiH